MITILAALIVSQAPTLVPVPRYNPKVGDTVVTYDRSPQGTLTPVGGAVDYRSHEDYIKATKANDSVGIKQLVDNGVVLAIDSGTPIKILSLKTHTTPPKMPLNPAPGYFRSDPGLALTTIVAVEARILDGKYKDKVVWLRTQDARLCEVVQPKTKNVKGKHK